MLAVSFAWIALVEATPASKRPYVGSSSDNTELGLTFDYNGLGRVEGQEGGPKVIVHPGGFVRSPRARTPTPRCAPRARTASGARPRPTPPRRRQSRSRPARRSRPNGQRTEADPFGGPPGPLRLFGVGLGDQGGWMLPFALFGLLGCSRCWRSSAPRSLGREAKRAPASAASGSRRGLPAPGAIRAGADRARRLVPRRGGRAEPLQGDRPPLLRLGARARHRRDGRRRRRRVRRARAVASARGSASRCSRARSPPRSRPDRAAAPRALHGVVHAGARRRRRRRGLRAAARRRRPRRRWRSRSRSCCSRADRLRDHHLARARRGHVPRGRTQSMPPAPGGYGVDARDLAINRALRRLRPRPQSRHALGAA